MSRLSQLLAIAEAVKPPMPAAPPNPGIQRINALQERQAIAQATDTGGDYFENVEIERICNLPIVQPMDPAEFEEFNRTHVMADQYDAGWRMFPQQAEGLMAYEMYGGLLGKLVVGGGKCVVGSTEIWDIHNGRRRVDELGTLTTMSMSEDGRIKNAPATAFASGQKPCRLLKLRSGQSVEISDDHPVFTHRGWIKASDLQYDDLVACPRLLPEIRCAREIPQSHVRLIAALAANGSTLNTVVTLCDEAGPLVDEFCEDVKSVGGDTKVTQSKSNALDVDTYKMLPFTRSYGLQGILSKHKRVPPIIYSLRSDLVALFLNRFLAADGHVNVPSGKIECTLASEGLIKDLQFLLLRLGILSRTRYKVAKIKEQAFDAWRLVISGRPNLLRFFETVGLLLGCEDACNTLWADTLERTGNTNTDIVPISLKEMHEISDELGYGPCDRGRPRTTLRKRLGCTPGQYISREKFEGWVNESGYSGKYAWLAYNDLAWEGIVSNEMTGMQPVYDLNVPGTHSFIGNGIVLHNTLLTLACFNHAYAKGIRRGVLFVPPNVLGQLVRTDIAFARAKVGINFPYFVLGGRDKKERRAMAASKRNGLYILPYSLLSTADASDNLHDIRPEIIIADEAHNLRHVGSARTKRVMSFIEQYHPEFVILSGTITKKSIKDYAHLIKPALKKNSPLPLSAHIANDWAALIDAKASTGDYTPPPAGTGPLLPLVQWARRNFPEPDPNHPIYTEDVFGFRRAFQARLTTAPGVVSAGDTDIGVSLVICPRPVENYKETPGFDKLEYLADQVQEMWLTPNGDELNHQLEIYKWLKELYGGGFYNQLTWPTPEAYAAKHKKTVDEATDLLEKAKTQHKWHNEYNKKLHKWLETKSKPNLDTPWLVGMDMVRNKQVNVGHELYEAWKVQKDLWFEGIPERDKLAVRVCSYKIDAMVKWVLGQQQEFKGRGAIIWVDHIEVGLWATEALQAAGVEAVHCPAGNRYNELICSIGDPNRDGKGDKVVVASYHAHGTGKNLQVFEHQYFLEWPRDAGDAEQTIGRTHRSGQQADELYVYLNPTTLFDEMCFAACINDSLYMHQSTGDRKKLIYAAYDPQPPRMFPPAALRQKGIDAMELDARHRQMMVDKFGDYTDAEKLK